MAKKASKPAKSNELDGKEFFTAIELIEKEKGIPKNYMLEKITQALISAYKRDHEGISDNVFVEANEITQTVRMFVKKEIVEEVTNPSTEIALDEARKSLPAAQTARQVIIQGMREAEHNMIYDLFSSKEHEMLVGTVTRIDPRNGAVSLRITSNGESTDAYLAPSEQVRSEVIREGDRLKVYVVEVRRSSRGPQVLISRTHPGLVKRLFELEVPEIYDGTVEIRSIAREAGSRTKLAVWSADENVDPIGACVGPKGARVNNVVAELGSEKIDIIKYSDDPAAFVAAALSPADVLSVQPLEGSKSCRVAVPDDQLSLAIGKEGQNARLAAKLTGYKIDIKAESAVHEWEEEDAALAQQAALAQEAPDEAAPLDEEEEPLDDVPAADPQPEAATPAEAEDPADPQPLEGGEG